MRYLCLVYIDPTLTQPLTEAEGRALTRESLAYDAELQKAGNFIHANALQEPNMAVTLRVRQGQVTSHDGPFAETKEHLGGFILIEARDLNEAVRIGSNIPMARMGSIEVRPIMDMQ